MHESEWGTGVGGQERNLPTPGGGRVYLGTRAPCCTRPVDLAPIVRAPQARDYADFHAPYQETGPENIAWHA